MNIAIYGTGRAAGSLALALRSAGHLIVGIDGRDEDSVEALTAKVGLSEGRADLRVIAVSDSAIETVARQIADSSPAIPTVHVSGAMPTTLLDPIARQGVQTGSFHPLQTLPDPDSGARALAGAWVAVTAPEPLGAELWRLAHSLGCHPFNIEDATKPLYHAAAAASANYTLAALAIAEELAQAADVPFAAFEPLVGAVVANAFEMGVVASLTGPIRRGDVDTVARQVAAIDVSAPKLRDLFVAMARVTAQIAGTQADMEEVLG